MNNQGFVYTVLPVFTNTMIHEWPYPVFLSNCSMASGCLGYRLFHISSSTFSFHKGTVALSCTCIATFRSCKMFDRSDTVFFCFFVNKVTATSHHAISTLDCHRHINLRKISSMQFPEPVDFLDASQADPDGMAINGSKVKTVKLFDSRKSHICHAICKYLARQVYNGTAQGQILALVYGHSIGQNEGKLWVIHLIVLHHHKRTFHSLNITSTVALA